MEVFVFNRFRIALALFAVCAAACVSDDPGTEELGSITVISPADGSTVSSPVRFEFELDVYDIVPADGMIVPGEGHLHIMVNTPCVTTRVPIPGPDEQHFHWGDASLAKEVELPKGTHELCVQVGSGNHAALPLTTELTITVE